MENLMELRRETCGEIYAVLNDFFNHACDWKLEIFHDTLKAEVEALLDDDIKHLTENDLLRARLNCSLVETMLLTNRQVNFIYS